MYLKESFRKNNKKTYSYFSIVESYRDENSRVKQRAIANLGNISREKAEAFLAIYKGTEIIDFDKVEIEKSCEYGASKFLDEIWKTAKLDKILSKKYSFRIKMMVINRLLDPRSKYDLINWFDSSLFSLLNKSNEVNYENLYRALDYLEENQDKIEEAIYDKKSKQIFYDITSSYFEGGDCEMSAFGYSRDRRKDKKQVVISLAINENKRPLAVKVLKGNTSDVTTVTERMESFKNRFSLKSNCVVMDRGMISKKNVKSIIDNGFEYILCLKLTKEIKEIISSNKNITFTKYDETLELKDIVKGNEKYIICQSKYKDFADKECRKKHIENTTVALEKFKNSLVKKVLDKEKIILRVSSILLKFKAKKYFNISYSENSFDFKTNQIDKSYDGIFVIKTSLTNLKGEEALCQYKNLKMIERAFREVKDFIRLRPMYHYKNERVKGHIFICFLCYYIYSLIEQKIQNVSGGYSVETLLDQLKKITINTFSNVPENKKIKISKINDDLLQKLSGLKIKIA